MSDSSESARLTLDALRRRVDAYDRERGADRLTHAVVRGGLAGLTLKGLTLAIGSALASLSRRPRSKAGPSRLQKFKSTLRFALFTASYAGVYVTVDELIAVLVGKQRSSSWRSLFAGALAGTTLAIVPKKEASTSLSVYIFVKGVVLLVRCGSEADQPAWLRRLLAPARWEHGDVLLMCLASSRVLTRWLTVEETPKSAYSRFLDRHGDKSLATYRGVRELVARDVPGPPGVLLDALRGTPEGERRHWITSSFGHPGQTALQHSLHLFPTEFRRALPVYLPVYLVPAILVHRSKLLDPAKLAQIAPRLGKGVLRSSLFLALYVTLAWAGIDAAQAFHGRVSPGILAQGFFWSGLATLVEKKSRRMELALYVLARAVEGALPAAIDEGKRAATAGLKEVAGAGAGAGAGAAAAAAAAAAATALGSRVPAASAPLPPARASAFGLPASIPSPLLAPASFLWPTRGPARAVSRADVLFFAAASACILHCYSDRYGARREVFRGPYRSVFDWIFGSSGIGTGDIRHAPSNAEIVAAISERSAHAVEFVRTKSYAKLAGVVPEGGLRRLGLSRSASRDSHGLGGEGSLGKEASGASLADSLAGTRASPPVGGGRRFALTGGRFSITPEDSTGSAGAGGGATLNAPLGPPYLGTSPAPADAPNGAHKGARRSAGLGASWAAEFRPAATQQAAGDEASAGGLLGAQPEAVEAAAAAGAAGPELVSRSDVQARRRGDGADGAEAEQRVPAPEVAAAPAAAARAEVAAAPSAAAPSAAAASAVESLAATPVVPAVQVVAPLASPPVASPPVPSPSPPATSPAPGSEGSTESWQSASPEHEP